MRQTHEDGPKPPNYSVPGLSVGNPISLLVNNTPNALINTSYVFDSEGIKMFSFTGHKANIHSCVIIAKFFDYLIMNFSKFKETERLEWDAAKCLSQQVSVYNEDDLLVRARLRESFATRIATIDKLLSKCNSMYGPMGETLNREVANYKELFQRSLE